MVSVPLINVVLFLLCVFLLGGLPTAYLMGRYFKGIDIRKVGSGNPGAANTFRSVGKTAGVFTLLIDLLKGWLPVWMSFRLFSGMTVPLLTGLAAVAGHTWSPFLKFRGGKGVATSAGVFAAIMPVATLTAFGGFCLGFGVSRHVAVGSLCGAMILPPMAFWLHGPSAPAAVAVILSLLVIIRHIPNMKRFLKEKNSHQR